MSDQSITEILTGKKPQVQLYNIVRTHRGKKSIVPGMERRPKAELEPLLRNLKRRARDSNTHVYFDLVAVPADTAAAVKPAA